MLKASFWDVELIGMLILFFLYLVFVDFYEPIVAVVLSVACKVLGDIVGYNQVIMVAVFSFRVIGCVWDVLSSFSLSFLG